MSKRIDCIYVDMDGVIADFNKSYKERFNMLPEDARSKKDFYNLFDIFIKEQGFANLDLMPDANLLISFLNGLDIPKEILSSTAREDTYDEISRQKGIWLQTHNIAWKRNFVPGKKHKYKYATPNSIIIDDTKSVIDDWNAAGGIGILHTDAISTISMLKMYI